MRKNKSIYKLLSVKKNEVLNKYAYLFDIVKLTEEELQDKVVEDLKSFGYTDIEVHKDLCDVKKGYVFAKGTLPVLLVAHVDTVHKEPVKNIHFSKDFNVVSSPQGFGGDDRCGVFMIFELLKKGLRSSILFVCGEEVGCIGSQEFCRMHAEDIGCNIVVQFDRKNPNDVVRYSDDNLELTEWFEKLGGFERAFGSCSDISYLCPHFGVSGVNISCGYYHEHHFDTSVVLSEMTDIINRCYKVLINENVYKNKIEYKEKKYNYYGYDYGYGYDSYFSKKNYGYEDATSWSKYVQSVCECTNDACCGCGDNESPLIETSYGLLCQKCVDYYVQQGWLVKCPRCGNYVEPDFYADGSVICSVCACDITKLYYYGFEDEDESDSPSIEHLKNLLDLYYIEPNDLTYNELKLLQSNGLIEE